jgi:hypothetical protein
MLNKFRVFSAIFSRHDFFRSSFRGSSGEDSLLTVPLEAVAMALDFSKKLGLMLSSVVGVSAYLVGVLLAVLIGESCQESLSGGKIPMSTLY